MQRARSPRRSQPPKRHTRLREVRFAIAVIAMMVAIFGVILWWPSDPIRSVSDQAAGQRQAYLSPTNRRFSCQVSYVNDGDTFRCEDGTRIRLHAVAARESDETCSRGHPCPAASAASATTALKSLVSGQTLSCEKTGMSYTRITAICWTPSEVEVNCAMIRSGTTVVWARFHRQTPICARRSLMHSKISL
jgi:endonuclease YncB( thermonuclease family)